MSLRHAEPKQNRKYLFAKSSFSTLNFGLRLISIQLIKLSLEVGKLAEFG